MIITTIYKECYLRQNPDIALKGNKVLYKKVKASVKQKCENEKGYAKFKTASSFKLVDEKRVGENVWGKMKSGYWVPLWHAGMQYVK